MTVNLSGMVQSPMFHARQPPARVHIVAYNARTTERRTFDTGDGTRPLPSYPVIRPVPGKPYSLRDTETTSQDRNVRFIVLACPP